MGIRRQAAAGVAVAAMFGMLGTATPAAAMREVARDLAQTCVDVLKGQPTGGLTQDTEPAPESVVFPGQEVAVTLSWDPVIFGGDQVHKLMYCVTVDGDLAEDLSTMVREVENGGHFKGGFGIPGDPEADPAVTVPPPAPGTEICGRGFVSGRDPGGTLVREKSDDACFRIGEPEVEAVEEAPPAVPESEVVPAGEPDEVVVEPARAPAALPAAEAPAVPAPSAAEAPAVPAPSAAEAPAVPAPAELPRTGDAARFATILAGVALALGGAAITAAPATRRRLWSGRAG